MIINKEIESLPSTFGVYIFKKGEEILYIGKSINIKARVKSHLENAKLDRKEKLIVEQSNQIEHIITGNEFKALLLESSLIKKLKPKYNVIWRDGKSYLYIKIDVKNEYPKISLSRKPAKKDKKSLYFGPFSSSKVVNALIGDLRKIVPFCTQKKVGKRECFYAKIDLCQPCPNVIWQITDPVKKEAMKKEYHTNISKIVKILRGKTRRLLDEFYRELKVLAKEKRYEEAIKIRNKIFRIEKLGHFSIEVPNKNDSPEKNLRSILKEYFPDSKPLVRIEAYDISNLGEKQVTASMVVANNGKIDKSQYRKFRITSGVSGDFDRLKEVMKRRLATKWPLPQLFVIDGGRGQLKAVIKAMREKGLMIPIIGIAKHPDRLIFAMGNFPVRRPGEDNPGFNLVRLLRDEAHRFARKYHIFLRNREFLV